MKYALKLNSPYIKNDWRRPQNSGTSIPRNKLYFLDDEKSIFNFLRAQMKEDLLYPINGKIRYSTETVTASDILGIFSYLSSSNLDFHFLCFSGRVGKFIRENIGTKVNVWSKLGMLRSMPFNYTLYKIENGTGGAKVMQNINWNRFIKESFKNKTISMDDLKYVTDK